MKLDSKGAKNGAYTAVFLEEVYSFGSDSRLSKRDSRIDCAELYAAFNQTQFFQVDQVVNAVSLGVSAQLIRRLASARVKVPQLFEKLPLQLPIQFHMSGLRWPFRVGARSYHGCAGRP